MCMLWMYKLYIYIYKNVCWDAKKTPPPGVPIFLGRFHAMPSRLRESHLKQLLPGGVYMQHQQPSWNTKICHIDLHDAQIGLKIGRLYVFQDGFIYIALMYTHIHILLGLFLFCKTPIHKFPSVSTILFVTLFFDLSKLILIVSPGFSP